MRIVQKPILMWTTLVLCAIALCASKTTFAQSAKPSSQQRAWINQEWKEPNLPFKKIRLDLDKSASQSKDALSQVKQFKALAKKEPANAQAQYKWAYATYQAATHKVPGAEPELAQVRQMLVTTVPKNYETARLRFLIEARGVPLRQLKPLGERLLAHETDDYDVKFRMIAILTPGLSAEEKKQALSYANDLIRIGAKRPSAYSALAGVYYRSWLISKSRDDAEKSIAAYRKYLQLAPANDAFRSQAQNIIAMMQKK